MPFPYPKIRDVVPFHSVERHLKRLFASFNVKSFSDEKTKWSSKKRTDYIKYCLEGGCCCGNEIWLSAPDWILMGFRDSNLFIIDGNERILSLISFFNNELSIKPNSIIDINEIPMKFFFMVGDLKEEMAKKWYDEMHSIPPPNTKGFRK
jgi:hypothetical protein